MVFQEICVHYLVVLLVWAESGQNIQLCGARISWEVRRACPTFQKYS